MKQKSYLAILPSILLIWGLQYLPKTYTFHQQDLAGNPDIQLSVLNYNTSYFRKTEHWKKEYLNPDDNQSAIKAKAWLQQHESDIYCFQEFYNDPNSDFYDVVSTLAPDSTYSVYLSGGFHPKKPILTGGMATISKFPVVQKGEIFTDKANFSNRSIFTDFLIKGDTIRVLNLHFHSMFIHPLPPDKNLSSFIQYTKDTYLRVKSGLLIRERQTKEILNFVNKSPHPVIIAGDFNEIPYGYVYRKFSQYFDNAFEEAGKGFGFSLNTTFPFLRIDNQFYDANTFDAIQYTTFRDITISEHYPIQTVYRFIK